MVRVQAPLKVPHAHVQAIGQSLLVVMAFLQLMAQAFANQVNQVVIAQEFRVLSQWISAC